MKEVFKAAFIRKYRRILKDEVNAFLQASSTSLLPCIRVNSIKISRERLEKRLKGNGYELKQIPWCRDAYTVFQPKVGLGKTIEHSLGYFYLQDAASIIPPLVLNPGEHEKVLDLCAAPGSKTTQIAQMMRNTGIIVANDPKMHRVKALLGNLQRCGVSNTIVTGMDGRHFSERVEQKFDRVLVDAPCSGSGTIRKRLEIAKEWSPTILKGLSELQKSLILSGFECLREGGVLVYSTCSLDPEENEEVVNYLLNKRGDCQVEEVRIDNLKARKGLLRWEGMEYQRDVEKCVRIYPQDNDTVGFFLAEVRRVEG